MDGERWALRKLVRGAFSLAFVGWFLVFFDVTITGFDILPDVVGYVLVAIACARLEDLHRTFAPVRWLAIMMSVVSGVMIMAPAEIRVFWWWVAVTLEVATMAWFCTAIATAAIEHQEDELAAIARSRRNWMIATSILAMAIIPVIPRSIEMAVLFGVVAIVMISFFLGLVRRAKRIAW